MERMRTFLLYALGILGFMFLSYVLENGLIENMYVKMTGDIETSTNISIEDVKGKASNVNGFMNFKLTNENVNAEDFFVKIDLISKQGLPAATKYVQITDLPMGESKNYQVKFKGSEIRGYKVSVVDEAPEMSNIINILGWEIDLSDVFGLDLTDIEIFGVKLKDLFTWDNAKTAGQNVWNWSINLLNSIPWWGYAIGAGIVLWYLPSGYLFGII